MTKQSQGKPHLFLALFGSSRFYQSSFGSLGQSLLARDHGSVWLKKGTVQAIVQSVGRDPTITSVCCCCCCCCRAFPSNYQGRDNRHKRLASQYYCRTHNATTILADQAHVAHPAGQGTQKSRAHDDCLRFMMMDYWWIDEQCVVDNAPETKGRESAQLCVCVCALQKDTNRNDNGFPITDTNSKL